MGAVAGRQETQWEMDCIYHLANFNSPNEQEVQDLSSHKVSDFLSEEACDSGGSKLDFSHNTGNYCI